MASWVVAAWIVLLAIAIARVFARQKLVEQTLRGAILRDRAYRGAGRLVRVLPGPAGLAIGRVALGRGQTGFGVLRLSAFAFELRGEGFAMNVDANVSLRVITHAALVENGIASVPVGTKLVLLVPLTDDLTDDDEPITLVDPRIDLLGHLREVRIVSRMRMAVVALGGMTLAVFTSWPALIGLALVAVDQVVWRGAMMWTLCSTDRRGR